MRIRNLQFPFVEIDPSKLAFVGIPNYIEVLENYPRDFRSFNNPWNSFAEVMILRRRVNVSRYKFREADPLIRASQMAYLNAWITTTLPKREEKVAVCAWLLSLMLMEVPKGN